MPAVGTRRTYRIDHYDGFWFAEIGIDHSNPEAEAAMRSSIGFFSGGEDLLKKECGGDVTTAFLKLLAPVLCHLSQELGNMVEAMGHEEGFPTLDGSLGIHLIHCERFEFTRDDFRVRSVEDKR